MTKWKPSFLQMYCKGKTENITLTEVLSPFAVTLEI